jgi:hypothetical protein
VNGKPIRTTGIKSRECSNEKFGIVRAESTFEVNGVVYVITAIVHARAAFEFALN